MPFQQEIDKNKYKGFALSEVLLAIVVILIVGIGSYVLYSNSRDQAETQEIMDTLNQIQTGIDKLIPLGRYHYTGSGNIMKPLIDDGLVDGGQMIAGTGGSAGEYYYLKNGVTYFATVDSTATGQYSYGISAIPIGESH